MMSDKLISSADDTNLFKLLCDGNREAFDQIYNLYWKKLFVAKAINDKEAAEDIVQEIFVSLWLRRETIVSNGTLAGYLFTAARYKGITYIQNNINKNKHVDSLAAYLTSRQDMVNEEFAVKELTSIINTEIEKLPTKMREVFVLSRRHDLSYREISEKLNISDKTVKKQISNALKHFKVVLNNSAMVQISFLLLFRFLNF